MNEQGSAGMAATPEGHTGRLLAVSAIAFLSGVAAMIYQINWQRDLTSILGASHYATTTIILAFFTGFALGAALARSRVDRVGNIFTAVALLEASIGAFGWGAPLVFDTLGWVSARTTPSLEEFSLRVVLTRSLLSTAALIVPTVCMGATLPFFFKAGILVQRRRGSRIGLIAGLNTLGAVTGSFATAFLLMGSLSGNAQLRLASLFNFAAVATAIPLALWLRKRGPARAPEAPPVGRGRVDRRVLGAYALSGAAGLSLEVVWNRLAFVSLQHTIYTFALTLSVYLAAYALGTLAASGLLRRYPATRNGVALLQLLALLTTLAGFLAFRAGLHAFTFSSHMGYFPAATLVVSIYVFLPTFFMGLSMPLVLQLLTGDLGSLGRDASLAQAVNNVGSIAAVFLVGFVLVPLTNLYWVTLFCLGLLAVAVLLVFDPPEAWPVPRRVTVTGAAALLVLAALFYPSSLYRAVEERVGGEQLARQEDESGLWSVNRYGRILHLNLNGYFENFLIDPPSGTVEGDWLIPSMVKHPIQDAYMVGLGFGLGTYELLRLPEIRRFDTAEISRASIALSRDTWKRYGGGIFADPRFRVFYEDGRIFLDHTDATYDLILSGTLRSFYPGSTHVYSREYWELVKERLNPGGLSFQWLPTYSHFSSAVLLKTYLSVFGDALVVRYGINLYLVGFRDGIPDDFEQTVREAYARARATLGDTSLPTAQAFFEHLYIPRRRELNRAEELPLNRDDFPVVEYEFRGFESERLYTENFPLERYAVPYSERRLETYRRNRPQRPQDLRR